MLALIAAACFLLGALDIEPDGLDLVELGLAFFAAHFAFPISLSRFTRRR